MPAPDTDPLVVLRDTADTSVSAVRDLKAAVDKDALQRAVRTIRTAQSVTVVGLGKAAPLAAFFADGLREAGYCCRLCQSPDRVQTRQIACLGADDVLAAMSIGNSPCPFARELARSPDLKVRVLCIVDRAASPVAQRADVSLVVGNAGKDDVQDLAPYFVLIQALLFAVSDATNRKDSDSPRNR